MKRKPSWLRSSLVVGLFAGAACNAEVVKAPRKPISAVFDAKPPLLMQDDFAESTDPLRRWVLNEDDRYDLLKANPARLEVTDAPGLPGEKAVRLFVPRAPNSFRAEITMPSENSWSERWYGERVLLPKGWVNDPSNERTIVMQWHGLPGNFRPTYPNLDISVRHDRWNISRSFGDPKTKATRDFAVLDGPIEPGVWVSWVLHAKWSPGEDGLLQIWRDGQIAFERHGPNVYGTIGINYTPYLQTGIYHPSWHITNDASQRAFEKETESKTPVASQTVYVTDVKIGTEHATYNDVAPAKRRQEQIP